MDNTMLPASSLLNPPSGDQKVSGAVMSVTASSRARMDGIRRDRIIV